MITDQPIALVAPYFGLFDEAMPKDFRADRDRHTRRLGQILKVYGEVLYPGLIDNEDRSDAVGLQLAAAGVEVVVVAPSMAAPPSYVRRLLHHLPQSMLVVVAAQDHSTVPDGYDTTEATRRSLPVGFTMITNVLEREGMPYVPVVGSLQESDFASRLGSAVSGAVAASALRGARLLRIGEPIPGYDDVEASPDDLATLSVEIVDVSPSELAEAYDSITYEQLEDQLRMDREDYDASSLDPAAHRRSAQLTCAIRCLVVNNGVDGGTVNCHGEHFRWNDRVGITACLPVARLTEAGRPFSCTGDVPNALALLLAKKVARAALYCELYQLDLDRDWLLIANGGEGDPGLCRPGSTVRLLPEDHYMGMSGAGTAIAYELEVGPATIMSLTPMPATDSGWRLIAAEGHIVGSKHHRMDGPNCMFSFDGRDVRRGFTEWAAAGASHHAVLSPGHHAESLATACRLLRLDFASITA